MISDQLLESIREHGKRAYPNECCGVLLGRMENSRKSVVELRPMENAREDSPRNRYLISPETCWRRRKPRALSGWTLSGCITLIRITRLAPPNSIGSTRSRGTRTSSSACAAVNLSI